MKKFVAIVMILAVMMTVGTAAYAANEEDPKDLITELVDSGFIYDEYEEVWMYIEYTFWGEGEYSYIHGWYDIENNIGTVFSVDYTKFGLVEECGAGSFRWNEFTHEFEEFGSFEWEH